MARGVCNFTVCGLRSSFHRYISPIRSRRAVLSTKVKTHHSSPRTRTSNPRLAAAFAASEGDPSRDTDGAPESTWRRPVQLCGLNDQVWRSRWGDVLSGAVRAGSMPAWAPLDPRCLFLPHEIGLTPSACMAPNLCERA